MAHSSQESMAVDAPSSATRTESYSLRMPRAPPVHIRPPDTPLNLPCVSSNSDCLAVGPPVHNPDPALNVDFLATSPLLRGPLPGGAWKYDMRRAAQPILPFLHLGPLSCARDPAALRDRGVTLLLAVHPPNGALLVAGAARAAQAAGVELRCVQAAGPLGLSRAFPATTRAINAHVAARAAPGASRACSSPVSPATCRAPPWPPPT